MFEQVCAILGTWLYKKVEETSKLEWYIQEHTATSMFLGQYLLVCTALY